MKNRVTELFKTRYPIVLGGLQLIGRAPLAAAVSEAGGLGLITAASFANSAELVREIAVVRKLTDKPFGVNISLGSRRDMSEFFLAALDVRVGIIFTSGRNPERFVPVLKQNSTTWVHVVAGVRYGLKAEELGADAVVMVSYEAGGHPGMDDVGGMALIPKAARELSIPVIAAGGIVEGHGLAAALMLGAEGVQIGTRFMATEECQIHPKVKEVLCRAREYDTVMVERSFRNARRAWRSPLTDRVLQAEAEHAPFEELEPFLGRDAYKKVMEEGKVESGILTVGQGVGSITEIKKAGDVIVEMVREAQERLQLVAGWFAQ